MGKKKEIKRILKNQPTDIYSYKTAYYELYNSIAEILEIEKREPKKSNSGSGLKISRTAIPIV